MEGKKGISEDWLSLWMGLFIFVLGLGLFRGFGPFGLGDQDQRLDGHHQGALPGIRHL